jgi:hypothetical protein
VASRKAGQASLIFDAKAQSRVKIKRLVRKLGRWNESLAHGSTRISADEKHDQIHEGLELDWIDPS